MTNTADLKGIRALSQLKNGVPSTLDVVLAENSKKFKASDFVGQEVEFKRQRIYSRLYNYSKALTENLGIPMEDILRNEVEQFLDNKFNAVFGVVGKAIEPAERIEMVLNNLSGTNKMTTTSIIRSLVGRKIPIRDINSTEWLDATVLSRLSLALSVSEEWILSGNGPASPYYERLGHLRKIFQAGYVDPATNAKLVETEVHIIRPFEGYLSGHLCIQKHKWIGEFGDFVTVAILAIIPGSEVAQFIEDASIKHAVVFNLEPTGGAWLRYLSGEAPMTVLFKDAISSRYKKGDLNG